MSTGGIDDFQYTKKYCIWIKKKSQVSLLDFFCNLFLFSAIIFHVYICETYATLSHNERLKNQVFSLINRKKPSLSLGLIEGDFYSKVFMMKK